MEQIFGGGAAWSFGSVIITLVIGFFVGLIARALKPGNDKLGFFMTIVLGILGALLARFIGGALGWYSPGEPAGFIASVVGAIVLLFIYAMVKKKA
ncbi:MAG TPA: GlsB/YeaQ/YmgE family stress response membrane protein [Pseudoxanthomonas sp.]|nr:GlsB/YeaQ/YmgE family stress response membrane protein [Pseudoxanthomonas sp.]